MKVCWKYTPAMGESGPAPRHVAEAFVECTAALLAMAPASTRHVQVGTLTMLDPNAMSECLVSGDLSGGRSRSSFWFLRCVFFLHMPTDANTSATGRSGLTTLVKKQMTPYAPMILSFRPTPQ